MGGFLAGLIVLLVAIGGCAFLGARIGSRGLLGIALGLVGTVMLCWPDGDEASGGTPRGIALQIGSSASYAAHILLLSHFGRRLPAVPFCLWQLMLVTVVAAIAAGVTGDWARVAAVEWSNELILAVAYLGVLATALGIAVQSRVQHRIPPTHVAVLFALQPVFAAAGGYLALGDRLGWLQLTGGGVIVAAVVLAGLDRSGRIDRPRAAPPRRAAA